MASKNITIKYYDEDVLETSLKDRFQYLCEFIGFGPEDIKLIKSCAGKLGPLVPDIVKAVYEKLFSFNVSKKHFTKRQADCPVTKPATVESLDFDHPHIKFRMGRLEKYLVKLVTAEYDDAFVQYLDWVGKIHTRDYGNPELHVLLSSFSPFF